MLPKKGIVLPSRGNPVLYAAAVANALQDQLGATHQAVKTVMRWTGAGERSVKNWLAGVSGPSGQHLIELIRHSDPVLEVLLVASGRQRILAAIRLVSVRNKIAEMLADLDATIELGRPSNKPARGQRSSYARRR
jgi:hypothetical protein